MWMQSSGNGHADLAPLRGAAVVVANAEWERASPEGRARVASAAGISLELAEALVSAGHDVPVMWARNRYAASSLGVELWQLAHIKTTEAARPVWADTLLVGLIGVVISLCGLLTPEWWVFLAVPIGAVVVHLLRVREWSRCEAALDARGGMQPTVGRPDRAGHPADVGAWAAFAVSLPRDSVVRAEAEVTVATLWEQHNRHDVAVRVLQDVARRQPDNVVAQAALASERSETGQLDPTLTVPELMETYGTGPFQHERHVAVLCGSAVIWPERCPRCNAPGTHPVRWTFEVSERPGGELPLVVKLLAGGIVTALLRFSEVQHSAVVVAAYCARHRWQLRLSWWGIVGVPVVTVFVCYALGSGRLEWALLLISVMLILWVACYAVVEQIAAARRSERVLMLRGTDRDFRESLPQVPDALL